MCRADFAVVWDSMIATLFEDVLVRQRMNVLETNYLSKLTMYSLISIDRNKTRLKHLHETINAMQVNMSRNLAIPQNSYDLCPGG